MDKWNTGDKKKPAATKVDKKKDDGELSEEDHALQMQIELLVTRTSDPELCLSALETMVSEVRTSKVGKIFLTY